MVNLEHDERKNIWVAASDGDLDRVKEGTCRIRYLTYDSR